MQLAFRTPYLSIREFDPIELPRLTVLTGTNGAGKSHLLQAIAAGHVAADDIQPDDIVMFNGETFRLDNQSPLTASQAIQERYNAWNFLTQQNNPHVLGNLNAFRNTLGPTSQKVSEICVQTRKALWNITVQDGLSEDEFAAVQNYKRQVQ